jgi:1,4-alpha-glucan branching enzyme
MKTEKEIKTKVINEVIEMVHEEIRSAQQGMNIYLPLNHLLIKFQSLLPKEEPEPTQEIKIEEKSISDFISEIKIDKSNFEHIAKTGKINGSLFLEIQDKMRAFACQEVTSVLFMDSEQEEAISKITHDAVTKLKKELLTKVQPTKTQEEMDREWKRESLIAHPMNDDSLDDLLQKAINYGRNTKQN